MITTEQLKLIMPFSKKTDIFCLPLNNAMKEFEICYRLRICAFIAQLAHESGSLNYVKELSAGHDYDIGAKAVRLGNTPEDDGDGEKYKGRGLIQVTGKANYEACSKALGMDFINKPELLELPEWATKSAAWFWKTNGLNELADKEYFRSITKRINGGYNGLVERQAFYAKALTVIK